MKKIYKTPEINMVTLAPELMQGLPPSSIGGQGSVINDDTGSGNFDFGGNGGGTVKPQSKGNSRFWDDEE